MEIKQYGIIPSPDDKPVEKWETRATFEAVIFRENSDNTISVYMHKQSEGGFWTVLRLRFLHGDYPQDVADRIEKELGGALIKRSQYVCLKFDEKDHNETFFSDVYLVELTGNPPVDDQYKWFDANNLPTDMVVEHHRRLIVPFALNAYLHGVVLCSLLNYILK